MPTASKLIVLILLSLAGCASMDSKPAIQSGLQKGDDIIPWNPIHVAGPNAGTNACPVCTYEGRPAIVIFTHDGRNAWQLADRLEDLVIQQQKMDLKGFVIVLNSTPDDLKQMADDQKITHIGICYPDPQTRTEDLNRYKINPQADNTVMVYKAYKVEANFVDLPAADFGKVENVVAGLRK
jgi:hypothetical protein